uniref:high affinity cationic amino acid transporter 1 n=1 Tax=Ciona intestinalis TaxID=7719 RepID=UPI000180D2CF|nr:high affinity cationic amino acid transporter 1 [Ciona intestinalis]|eukprot:XP_002124711.1 high affinity cationic amino acid transporter 1 [Ciona intestinalis]
MWSSLIQKFARKKVIEDSQAESSDLQRCLSTFDLVAVGVGSTLGAGVYVLTGSVAKTDAGPAMILSFTIAAFASMLAGLCYSEFGARVPKAGSAYIYSYVTVGELGGFIIGWNLVLEYIIGVSSVARAWSSNLDSLTGGAIANASRAAMPMNIQGFATYPDFLAVGLIVLVTILLSTGMGVSSKLMTVLTAINILVLIFCAVAGFIKADVKNWQVSAAPGRGNGGFMPYGFSKMMEGAASCFYAFVGFDTIACVGEEAKNPSKSIPRSIIITLLVCLLAYVTVSASLTLMQPYYLLDVNAPLPIAFIHVGFGWASKPVAVGSMCALMASVLGAAVGMPRIVFSMARDGLIFKFLGRVMDSNGTPVIATIVSGFFSAFMALIFDLSDLVKMMSIGTLMAYTLVACSVLLLRFRPDKVDESCEDSINHSASDEVLLLPSAYDFKQLWKPVSCYPTNTSSNIVLCSTLISVATMVLLSVLLILGGGNLSKWWGILLIVVMVVIILTLAVIIARQPQSRKVLLFKTPLVPCIPLCSIFFNIYLMLKLPGATWIRFGVWMVVGAVMYFGYGIFHSTTQQQPMVDETAWPQTQKSE